MPAEPRTIVLFRIVRYAEPVDEFGPAALIWAPLRVLKKMFRSMTPGTEL